MLMHCVDAMRYKVMRKGDALQISLPIRQTSPGGDGTHTCTELHNSADERRVNLNTKL